MKDIDVVKKSIAKPVPFTVKQEDGSEETIYLKQFTVGQQARALTISKKLQVFEEFSGDNTTDKISKMTDEQSRQVEEGMNEAFDLLVNVVQRSIDEIDEETAKEFVNSHFEDLMVFMNELSPKSKESEKAELVQKRKKEQEKAKK